MNAEPIPIRESRTVETLRLQELVRLADAVELAALDHISGYDPLGERCRRCGLGHPVQLREALEAYRKKREAMGLPP